ncbi:MAG: hypothetical protein LQ338_007843, partial [Usnochroma carphineum]
PKPGARPQNGINGLHVRGSMLYFTNTNFETFNRMPINIEDGSAAGAASTVVAGLAGDDFAVDGRGNAYVCVNSRDEVVKVEVGGGGVTVLAGVAGPTSVAFGRGGGVDRRSLYVSSDGGIPGYVSGNFTVGGRVSRIDVGLGGYYR